MGKYYSAAADSHAVTDANSFALANLDIIAFARWFAGSIAFGDIRVSDLKRDAGQVNKSAVAAPLGFEPRITPPKGAVLPLHHRAKFGDVIADLSCQR